MLYRIPVGVCVCVCVLYLTVCVLQTDNKVRVVFQDHSPEICHRAAQRSLAHYELFTLVMSLWKTPAASNHQPMSSSWKQQKSPLIKLEQIVVQLSHRDVGGVDVPCGVCF